MGNPDQAAAAAAAPAAAAAAAPAGQEETRFQIKLGADWKDFDAEDNKALVKAFETGQQKATITQRGQSYEFDFKEMTQKNPATGKSREIRAPYRKGGYSAAAAPGAPYPDGETEADKGLLGGLGGAAAAAGGLGVANHFGAFAGKVDPNDPEGKKHGFVQDHKVMAGLLAVGGVVAAGIAGHMAEDGLKGKKNDGKHGKSGKDSKSSGGMLGGLFGGKKKTGKKKDKGKKGGKKEGGKKDKKCTKGLGDGVVSRDFDPNAEDSDSDDSVSSYETGPEDEGYDPVKHSDGTLRTP